MRFGREIRCFWWMICWRQGNDGGRMNCLKNSGPIGLSFLIELTDLHGRRRINRIPCMWFFLIDRS